MNEPLIETGIVLTRPARRAVRRPKRARVNETDIVKAILEVLQLHKVWSWRVNSGALPTAKKGGGEYRVKQAPAGTPDIFVVLPGGRLGGLEVKSATGVQRPSQRVWEAKAQLHGVLYAVVRSQREAVDTVQVWMRGAK